MIRHDEGEEFQPASAAEWFLVLREDPADTDLKVGFEAWLEESEAHRREWAQISHTLSVLRKVEPTQVPARSGGLANRASATRRRVIVPLSLAAAVAAGIIWGPDALLHLQADAMTGRQETRVVALADGSQVVLAPESAIATHYTQAQRTVHLLKGEALFTVRHDSLHPFRVVVGSMTVTDVGTVFDVSAEKAGDTEVAVREGRVSVEEAHSHEVPVMLGSGQVLQTTGGKNFTGDVAPQEVGLWAQGVYVAHGQPVSEVVEVLSRYMRGTVVVHGRDLAREKVSGLYKLSDAHSALQTLAAGQNARVWHVTPWLTIINR